MFRYTIAQSNTKMEDEWTIVRLLWYIHIPRVFICAKYVIPAKRVETYNNVTKHFGNYQFYVQTTMHGL